MPTFLSVFSNSDGLKTSSVKAIFPTVCGCSTVLFTSIWDSGLNISSTFIFPTVCGCSTVLFTSIWDSALNFSSTFIFPTDFSVFSSSEGLKTSSLTSNLPTVFLLRLTSVDFGLNFFSTFNLPTVVWVLVDLVSCSSSSSTSTSTSSSTSISTSTSSSTSISTSSSSSTSTSTSSSTSISISSSDIDEFQKKKAFIELNLFEKNFFFFIFFI